MARLDAELRKMAARVAKVPLSPTRQALQVHGVRLRLWADDDGTAVRPWYVVILELYPRGKVINQYLARPVSRKPDASELLRALLRHVLEPPSGEPQARPTHVSFVDQEVADAVAPALPGVKVERLTLADGVSDYVGMFSERLFKSDKGSRAENAELPGILQLANVDECTKLMHAARRMWKRAPWCGISDTVAIKATIPVPDKRKDGVPCTRSFYVSVLGNSNDSVMGFAIMPTLKALRTKYRRHQQRKSLQLDGVVCEEVDDSKERCIVLDSLVCGACGKRIVKDDALSNGASNVASSGVNGHANGNGNGNGHSNVSENKKEHESEGEGSTDDAVYAWRCGGCQRLFYCDEQCQRSDWKRRHSTECAEAAANPEYTFKRPEWTWLAREVALLFVDPTAVPFDDLDAFDAHQWPYADDQSPPLYPLAFVTPIRDEAIPARPQRPTGDEVSALCAVAAALAECSATPPKDTTLHLQSGVSMTVAEDLRLSCAGGSQRR